MPNVFANLPESLPEEVCQDLFCSDLVRIERILSQGHTAPTEGWFDQEVNEWVLVLQGAGRVRFADGHETHLGPGDFLNIPAHTPHQVVWTDPEHITLWLAVFYG